MADSPAYQFCLEIFFRRSIFRHQISRVFDGQKYAQMEKQSFRMTLAYVNDIYDQACWLYEKTAVILLGIKAGK